ncbi:MAG: hypothetical protein ACM31H_03825 [Nitrososphaerales archaeon]
MGYKDLSLSAQSSGRNKVFEGKQTKTTGKNGTIFRFPAGAGKVHSETIFVHANPGSCYVKITNSPRNEIRSYKAIWTNSALGTVTNKSDKMVIAPCTGIRLIRISGTVSIEITAQ